MDHLFWPEKPLEFPISAGKSLAKSVKTFFFLWRTLDFGRKITFNLCSSVRRILKRGGLFWKSEKCANDLDSNFHWSWISFRRFVRNLRRNVSFFRPKSGGLQKKKKKRSLLKVRPVFHPNSLKFPAESLMPNLQRGGAMPQFCSLYYAILQS